MTIRKRASFTKQQRKRPRRCCGLSLKNILQFLSSLILPLMLGVFTVIITFQQLKISRNQRVEDMQVSRQQRLEDHDESRIQREQEWNISQIAQAVQGKTVIDQYRDELLVAYIKEMGDLLVRKNGLITSDFVSRTLARVKTLNVLRQLNGVRQTHLIGFLYEAGLLTTTNQSTALDISTAELVDVDFRKCIPSKKIKNMVLAGVYLQNCTFERMRLENIDFSSSILSNVNFSFDRLYHIDFSSAQLFNTNFQFSSIVDVSFRKALLENVSFSSSPRLLNVDFTRAKSLYNVNFSLATLDRTQFRLAKLDNIDFTMTKFYSVNFSFARFESVLNQITRFNSAKVLRSRFENCFCQQIDFTGADFKNSIFNNARLTKSDFVSANFQNVDFSGATLRVGQLQDAFSIRDVRLPNGTLGYRQNWVKNADADCNRTSLDYWQIEIGSVAVMLFNDSQCHFAVESTASPAMMSQRMILKDIWDSSFWRNSFVDFEAEMSDGVSIDLLGKNRNGTIVNQQSINSTVPKTRMKLEENMVELTVVVRFDMGQVTNSTENSWCDHISVFVEHRNSLI